MTQPDTNYSEKEIARIASDSDWWKETANLIGCSVQSFTERRSANFYTPIGNGCMAVPGCVADKIRLLGGLPA